jgi:hypothetical protein
VARLLGAEDLGEGIAVTEDRIAIEGGATLIVAGPALRPDDRVGWSVRPERVRLNANGRYEATIENTIAVSGGYEASVRLGTRTLLRALVDTQDSALNSRCRLDIDPGAIQVWKIA